MGFKLACSYFLRANSARSLILLACLFARSTRSLARGALAAHGAVSLRSWCSQFLSLFSRLAFVVLLLYSRYANDEEIQDKTSSDSSESEHLVRTPDSQEQVIEEKKKKMRTKLPENSPRTTPGGSRKRRKRGTLSKNEEEDDFEEGSRKHQRFGSPNPEDSENKDSDQDAEELSSETRRGQTRRLAGGAEGRQETPLLQRSLYSRSSRNRL